jgi:hypothetical protein
LPTFAKSRGCVKSANRFSFKTSRCRRARDESVRRRRGSATNDIPASMTTWRRTVLLGLSTPSSMSWISMRWGSGSAYDDRAAALPSRHVAEALHLWVSQPRAVEPATGMGSPAQRRADVADGQAGAGPQNHRQFPRITDQRSRLPAPLHCSVPPGRPVHPHGGGGGWQQVQGGEHP